MIGVQFSDDGDETRKVSITFDFNGDNADELSEAAALVQASMCMAPSGSRLEVELEAHVAYLKALESGLRRRAASLGVLFGLSGSTATNG